MKMTTGRRGRRGTDLGRVVVDDLLGGKIALVADQQLVDALARVAVNLLQPLLDVVERDLVCDVVHDDDAVRAAVVARRNGTEALLAGGIPLCIKREREPISIRRERGGRVRGGDRERRSRRRERGRSDVRSGA